MADEFKLIGAEAIEALLKQLPDRVARNVTTNALRAGARVVQRAAIAKLRSNPSVDTGTLVKAIAIKAAKKSGKAPAGTLITVGIAKVTRMATPKGRTKPVKKSPARYAHLVEFGTEHMPAEPFMRPAVDGSGGAAVSAIIEAAGRALNRETAKLASGKTNFVTGKRIG